MLTKKQKAIVRQLCKIGRQSTWQRVDLLEARQRLKAHIEACTENGKIAITRSGMDCDCTSYTRVSHVPTPLSVYAFEVAQAKHEEWLDGPENTWISKPSEEPEYHNSIDLALEAYEDGHPSTVYYRQA